MKKWVLALLIGFMIALDQLSKLLVIHHLGHGEVLTIFPGFKLHLALNHGVAFSLFYQTGVKSPWILIVLSILLTMVLASMLWRTPNHLKAQQIALSLIMAGAVSNMLDRMSLGAVIDFVDWYVGQYHWPVFNLADSFICVGAVWLTWKGYQDEGRNSHVCSSHKGT